MSRLRMAAAGKVARRSLTLLTRGAQSGWFLFTIFARSITTILLLLTWAVPAAAAERTWTPIGVTDDDARPLMQFTEAACDYERGRWRGDADSREIVDVWRCATARDAAMGLWYELRLNGGSDLRRAVSAPPDAYLIRRWPRGRNLGNARSATVVYARSEHVVRVVVGHWGNKREQDPAPVALTHANADRLAQAPSTHVEAPPDLHSTDELAGLVIGAYLLLFLPVRLFRGRGQRRRMATGNGDPQWRDVQRDARNTKWAMRVRAGLRLSALYALLVAATVPSWIALVFAVPLAIFGWVRPPKRARAFKQARPRRADPRRLRTWLAPLAGTASLGAIALSLVAVVAALISYNWGVNASPGANDDGFLEIRYMGVTDTAVGVLFEGLTVLIGARTMGQWLAIGALLLLSLAVWLRRIARRALLADAARARDGVKRRPIVHLRNFGSDRVRMASSALARATLVERLTPFNRQPFEEVLVRHLALGAPVIAASRPGAKLPTLGAAKEVFADASWQDAIDRWLDGCGVAVVDATPWEISQGLAYEIEALARRPWIPVLLVYGPHRPKELAVRAYRFHVAASVHQRFCFAPPVSGTHVTLVGPKGAVCSWGAQRRSEWTYATALRAALEELEFALAAGTPQPTRRGS